MKTAVDSLADLQRGIQLAFAVPETHVASAISYLLGDGPADEKFADDIANMFEELATPDGWSLCAHLLKIRLELRAARLHQTRNVTNFFRLLERRPG